MRIIDTQIGSADTPYFNRTFAVVVKGQLRQSQTLRPTPDIGTQQQNPSIGLATFVHWLQNKSLLPG
jgi:hypothetical protein